MDITPKDTLQTTLNELNAIETELKRLEDLMTNARNQRKAKRREVWELVMQARTAVKANYGPDSSEYERFGGTRMSERKRSGSKTETS